MSSSFCYFTKIEGLHFLSATLQLGSINKDNRSISSKSMNDLVGELFIVIINIWFSSKLVFFKIYISEKSRIPSIFLIINRLGYLEELPSIVLNQKWQNVREKGRIWKGLFTFFIWILDWIGAFKLNFDLLDFLRKKIKNELSIRKLVFFKLCEFRVNILKV